MSNDLTRDGGVLFGTLGGEISRRALLKSAVAVGLGASLGVQLADGAGATGEGGIIYGIKQDGTLLWYRHEGRDGGTATWTSGTGKVVGSGWGSFTKVFSG